MTADAHVLLPRAPLRDVLRGRAPLVGSRCDPGAPRGFVSPIEAPLRLGLCHGSPAEEEAPRLAPRERSGGLGDLGVLARAALAALWPAGGRPEPRPFIVSARVDNVTAGEALEAIFAPSPGRATMIHFVHAHALNLAALDPSFAALLGCADRLFPDGIGLRVAGALLDVAVRANVNGTDLLPLLCREAARREVPLAFVGAAPGVAERCAERLAGEVPGLRVAFTEHGYLSPEEAARVAGRVRAAGRVVVLVGMGSPLQERWAWRHLAPVPGATVLTVGGLFDFFSGRVPRAPAALREVGLEWAYRLAQEPRRMAGRYLLGNPLFLALTLAQRARGRRAGNIAAGEPEPPTTRVEPPPCARAA
jgi:N-acetylglucosaminyldiphosphoundecaprenol N-acetyl-beta-D-mannosaminyltransferase